MKYETPITSPEHAEFCKREAERKYVGKIIKDEFGMLLVKDKNGLTHTDKVLRALSQFSGMSDWELIENHEYGDTWRLVVPGGWLYRIREPNCVAVAFVPLPDGDAAERLNWPARGRTSRSSFSPR